jgi:hypothetical protein
MCTYTCTYIHRHMYAYSVAVWSMWALSLCEHRSKPDKERCMHICVCVCVHEWCTITHEMRRRFKKDRIFHDDCVCMQHTRLGSSSVRVHECMYACAVVHACMCVKGNEALLCSKGTSHDNFLSACETHDWTLASRACRCKTLIHRRRLCVCALTHNM